MNPYALIAGILVAIYVVIRLRITRLERRRWVYPVFLATFPLYYWVFALVAGDYIALQKEMLFGTLFIVLALVAYKMKNKPSLLLLSSAYIGHSVYDVLHGTLFVNAGAPAWWPEFCGAVDVLVGLYIVYLAAGIRLNSGEAA